MPFPFEIPFEEVRGNLDHYVDEVFGCLQSEFLVLPKGPGFVEYPLFEEGFEALKKATGNFHDFSPERVYHVVVTYPMALILLRCMLGFTPPEWAYVATQRTGVEVTQGAVRSLDRKIRMNPRVPLAGIRGGLTMQRVQALVETACVLLVEGAPSVPDDKLHRLNKADTMAGLVGLRSMVNLGVPYPVLLYERFLGRPFAGHRDSVSELVGDMLENAIEEVLHRAGISFRKTKRAQRLPGFDQAPDFIIPNEFNPKVIIEAKLTEDDGTARVKVTRVQHLSQLSLEGQSLNSPKYEVIACIAGRGFGVRREDMKKLLLATRGKVFTLQNMNQLIDKSSLKCFRTLNLPESL
ncbi:MAG: hypothetical protein HQL74_02600 [Magnetococcales bacterium]|nr:hypothetical protein [Magnetococcales bacterium]